MTQKLLLLVLAVVATGCGTPKSAQKNEKPAENWDYQKIRQAREAERLETPTTIPSPDESRCVVLSDAERKRARASGCKPLDPRAGHGEGKFCCDPSE
jgi:hypothetical protein